MYKIKSIGKIKSLRNTTLIHIDKKYRKALKYLEKFSHIHVFFLVETNKEYDIKRTIVEVKEIDLHKGSIITSMFNCLDKEAELIDVKPYFPSEDTVKAFVCPTQRLEESIHAEITKEPYTYEAKAIGEIRNVKGKIYIQLNQMITVTSIYITIFWWFHKFDSDKYRSVTECTPPYENAPRTGIFATRSPVRPNPIAMTVARILELDVEKKRIYLNKIESFDKTPCLGISEYDTKEHCIRDCRVPEGLMHWPKYIDDTTKDSKISSINLIDSKIKNLLFESSLNTQIQEDNEIVQDFKDKRHTEIIVRGAKENNLQSMNVRISYGKITAVVGVSGSGKSSLVNQTIYAECRRRMEYLSNSHNVFQKPKVDEIIGCIPAVVITQDAIRGNAFSTVGTYTDAYDYLRSIYAQVSVRHCPGCGNEMVPLTKDKILNILKKQQHFSIYNLSNEVIKKDTLEQMVEKALEDGEGAFYVCMENKEKILFQTKQKCYHCNKIMFEMTPATFSYMDTDNRCPVCRGTGKISVIDENKVIERPELSLLEGASSFYGKLRSFQNNPNANWMKGQVFGLADIMKVDLEKPWCELPIAYKEALLYGSEQEVTFSYDNKKNGRKGEITRRVEGIYSIIERSMEENKAIGTWNKYMKNDVCSGCDGERLAMEGRIATINGVRYPQAAKMSFYNIVDFCIFLKKNLCSNEFEKIEHSVNPLFETSKAAINLGIGYLELCQETSTLSGGEGQRLKLLGAFKNHISGILYIFDEPSKGLHPKDYRKIIDLMKTLIQEGNTIIIVEHNEDMIQIADYIIEIGPGAGEKGGMIVGEGTLKAMLNHNDTQIYQYRNRVRKITNSFPQCLTSQYEFLTMQNMTCHNLKNIDIEIPLKALTCICGVSGSGKTSLVKNDIYMRARSQREFSDVVLADQLPIGKTSKSIIATYIGIMDFIRSEFANTAVSVQNVWDESYFSFNNQVGQCDTCKGEGKIKIKFTEDASVQCPDCHGKRYKEKILEVLYKGKNLDEILNLSVGQAVQFWDGTEEAIKGLRALQKVGLGYLKLGQGTSTLSGGEASRLKLAKELIKKPVGNMLYLLDEPTTGLHFSDIENLLKLVDELIKGGNTVIAIEHNKQFVEHCNWKIELGPGAGKKGGNIIYQGYNINQ